MKFHKRLEKCWKKIFGISSHNPNPSTFEDFKVFLPKYLSDEEQQNLFSELERFPENIDSRFYTNVLRIKNILFQGDGFKEVLIPDYKGAHFRKAKGFLISNTCDVSAENKRTFHVPSFSFAPIVDLRKYHASLIKRFGETEAVAAHIDAIQKQKITSLFYLPPNDALKNGGFAILDSIFSIPAALCDMATFCKNRLFTLSQYGHYVLLFKFSVHFSRVQEAISRNKI